MLFLLILTLVSLVVAKNELYMGYKVYNVKLSTQEQQDSFHLLKTDIIDYWRKPNFKYGITGLAMVPPSQFNFFEEKLEELGLEIDVAIEDVYEYLLQKDTPVRTRNDDNGDNNSGGNNNTDENEGNANSDEDHGSVDTDENENNGNTDEDEGNNNNTDENNNSTDEDSNNTEDTEEVEESEESEEAETIFGYDDFYRYSEILDHIYRLRDTYENSTTVSIEVVEFETRTDYNRELVYFKVTNGNTDDNKPVIVIESGINPREWITIPAAFNIVDNILEDTERRYLDNFVWIIIPVVNPDGYEYTHTDLRLWEKNLSQKTSWGFICPGVNINRNFDIDWSISDSSSSACSHLFAGEEAVSEPETKFVQNIIETYRERIRMYVSLQYGGGSITYPWQYEFAASGTFRQNHLLGMEMIAAMEDEYTLDTASVALGDRASGTSSDFARINDVMYAFNIDIASRGLDGVIVPKEDIVDIVEDVWRAVVVAADSFIQ